MSEHAGSGQPEAWPDWVTMDALDKVEALVHAFRRAGLVFPPPTAHVRKTVGRPRPEPQRLLPQRARSLLDA